jgi:hypothetical protein
VVGLSNKEVLENLDQLARKDREEYPEQPNIKEIKVILAREVSPVLLAVRVQPVPLVPSAHHPLP